MLYLVKKKIIDTKYNFCFSLFYQLGFDKINKKFYNNKYDSEEECIKNQVVIHFLEKFKPWKYDMELFSDMFKKYYYESPYSDKELCLKHIDRAMGKRIYDVEQMVRDVCEIVNEREKQIREIQQNYDDYKEISTYRFPYEKIRKGSKVILYGAGKVGKDLYETNSYTKYCDIVLWADKSYESIGGNVHSPEEIKGVEYDVVLVAISNRKIFEEIKETLISMEIRADLIKNVFTK